VAESRQLPAPLLGLRFYGRGYHQPDHRYYRPSLYDNGGLYAWPGFLQHFWADMVVPNMLLFIILYAAIELALGLLVLNRGGRVKIGLAGARVFGAGLLMLGLGAKQGDWAARIPNLAFEAMILYCLFFDYPKTLMDTIRRRPAAVKTTVIGG
jgi:hypothetical protein